MKRSAPFNFTSLAIFIGAFLFSASLVTCGGGGGGGGGSSTGTVNTSISDPPVCKTTFQSVWITITRVRAHASSNAGPNDSGWIDLLDLRNNPKQIDLMNLSQTDCLLTQLGSTSGIPAGQYQQIRLYLLSNNPPSGTASPNPNNCAAANGFNCVVTSNGTQILQLSSEAQTGIKIPSGQIAGGGLVVSAGQVVDLNIDFDACSSIVQQGSGPFRLKPVSHAAEVSSTNPTKISGTVVDFGTQSPISGAVVFLEQKDLAGIDRMIMQTLSKSDGTFIFCPVSSGSFFDVVVDALVGSIAYNATITFGVPSGTAMGNIPIIAETGVTTSPATITGKITTTTGTAATQADISLSALQLANGIPVTIPPLGSSTSNVTTQPGNCTPSTADCIGYTLIVPASNPSSGTFVVNQSTDYSVPADPPINYAVIAQAFTIPTNPNPGVPDCFPPSLTAQVTVQAGLATNQDFPFTGCQQ